MAKDIMTARKGSKVLGIGAIDVRSPEALQKAVDTCVKELGAIDFLMYVPAKANGTHESPCISTKKQAS
jgi:hypothetical protein